jgi:tetratricopeptide (TPR) repeat protein
MCDKTDLPSNENGDRGIDGVFACFHPNGAGELFQPPISIPNVEGSTMRALLVVLVLGSAAAGPCWAQGKTWVGKTILLKKYIIKIGHTGEDGKQVYVGELTKTDYRVLAEQDGWLKVNDGRGNDGWFDKVDAVHLDDAVAFFTDRIRQNARDSQAYSQRGRARELTGKLDTAITDFDEAIRLNPHPSVYNNRGLVWSAKKQYDKAITDFDETIRLNPNNPQAFANRGFAWYRKTEYDKAIADYNEAIRLDGRYFLAYVNRGDARFVMKDYDQAIADFDEAIRLNPKDAIAYNNRGSAWIGKKHHEKALSDYNEARRLDREYKYPLVGIAWILATAPDEKLRNGKRAVEVAKEAFALDKKDARIMDALAAAYAETGDFVEAVRWQQRVLEDPQYKNNAGMHSRLELFRKKKPYREE